MTWPSSLSHALSTIPVFVVMTSVVTEKNRAEMPRDMTLEQAKKKMTKIKKSTRNCNRHFVGNVSLQFNCCDLMSLTSFARPVRSPISKLDTKPCPTETRELTSGSAQ